MENKDAPAIMASPKKCTKKYPGAQKDQMANTPGTTAGSGSSCPKPWPKKAKIVIKVVLSGLEQRQCKPSTSLCKEYWLNALG
jgi:hypothetical protein